MSNTSSKYHSSQTTMPILPIQDIPSPFGDVAVNLSDSELRETAYEILVAACRSTGMRPLTFTSQPEKTERSSSALTPSTSFHRSLTSTAASRVKKALGLKTTPSKKRDDVAKSSKRSVTTGELTRLQMKVSEQTDSRIHRALLRVSAGQV